MCFLQFVRILILIPVLLALTACGGTTSAGIDELLPLAEARPTLVFFYAPA